MCDENRKSKRGKEGQVNSVASIVSGLEIVTGLEKRPSTVSDTYTTVLLLGDSLGGL